MEEAQPGRPVKYHGFYRNGKQVVFSYARDGQEWLDRAAVENGEFVRHRALKREELIQSGSAQWPEWLRSAERSQRFQTLCAGYSAAPETSRRASLVYQRA